MRWLIALGLGLGLALPAQAVEISPLYGLQLLGGQYFFKGEKGNLTGNVSGMVAPALKFSESWSVLPTLNASYRGTKQVIDLVGAGTLFQEEMDHRIGVKGIFSPEGSRWRIKPAGHFKWELLKDTTDEKWGKGLFDYRKWGLGAEGEFVYREPFSVRTGFDYFRINFHNYESLESQIGVAGLSRELASDHVLDTENFAGFVAGDLPIFDRFIVDGSLSATFQRFPNQHRVDETGNLTAPLRKDVITAISAGAKMPHEFNSDLRTLAGLDVSYSHNSSDQNSYDAQRTRFLSQYYNYGEIRVGPSFKLLLGDAKKPIALGLGMGWWYRDYSHRLAQDATGNYLGETIHTTRWMLSSSLNYPMAPNFGLVFNIQYGQSSSNQRYEQSYSYNYKVTNYLFGFTYDY